MSYKKIYLISVIAGLIIGLGVIVVVKFSSSTPIVEQSSSGNFSGWVEVAPPTRLFTASFPTSPERTEDELPIPDTDYSLLQESHVAVDAKGNIFRIVTFVYPQPFGTEVEQTDEVLGAALQGMVAAAPGSTLLEDTNVTFDNLHGKIFTIQDADGYYHQGELFLKGRVLYQAFVTYDAGDLSEEDLQHFLDTITPSVEV